MGPVYLGGGPRAGTGAPSRPAATTPRSGCGHTEPSHPAPIGPPAARSSRVEVRFVAGDLSSPGTWRTLARQLPRHGRLGTSPDLSPPHPLGHLPARLIDYVSWVVFKPGRGRTWPSSFQDGRGLAAEHQCPATPPTRSAPTRPTIRWPWLLALARTGAAGRRAATITRLGCGTLPAPPTAPRSAPADRSHGSGLLGGVQPGRAHPGRRQPAMTRSGCGTSPIPPSPPRSASH